MADALNGLIAANATAIDPTALFSGTDTAFDATITETLDGIEISVSSIETTVESVDSYIRTMLKSSVDGVRSVVNGIRSAINSMWGVINHMFDLVFDAWGCVSFTGICGNGH